MWAVGVTRRPGTWTPIETGWAAGVLRPAASSTTPTDTRPRCCTATWPRPRPSWRWTVTGACGPRGACCLSCRWGPAASRSTPPVERQESFSDVMNNNEQEWLQGKEELPGGSIYKFLSWFRLKYWTLDSWTWLNWIKQLKVLNDSYVHQILLLLYYWCIDGTLWSIDLCSIYARNVVYFSLNYDLLLHNVIILMRKLLEGCWRKCWRTCRPLP